MVWKSRPLDLVARRHIGQNGRLRTSLVILGEDGSLKVFDSSDSTDFWLSPRLRPQADSLAAGARSTSKKGAAGAAARKVSKYYFKGPNGIPVFPTDFFEHCNAMNEVEFGGNDILQIYNVAQLKNRLNTSGIVLI